MKSASSIKYLASMSESVMCIVWTHLLVSIKYKHLFFLYKWYIVDNYNHMKNFQVLSQSDSLKWCPHTHFKNWKKEKNGKTDLICAQLTLQLTFFIGPGPGPVQDFIKILMFDTDLRNISFRFQCNLRNAHYN